jgi:Ran GTPase-activating protein (RanGAP) involved in mRNA processing and transport
VLEQLDLSNNAFGDKGGAWFGQGVESNRTLQTLDLSACGIAETACMVSTLTSP